MSDGLGELLPQFIIAGAAKSGTTALANQLRTHPDIAISSPKETMAFCIDDIYVHPDLFFESFAEWKALDFEADPEGVLRKIYGHAFRHAEVGTIRGDATPLYMFSELAVRRIATFCPDARIIFLLRHPTARCISNYWHEVRSGRASRPFWTSIRFEQPWAFYASSYRRALAHWYRHFDAEQILVLPFEQWKSEKELTMRRILEHIGVEYRELEVERTRQNRGQSSISPLVDRLLGEFVQQVGGTTYNWYKYTEEGKEDWNRRDTFKGTLVGEARKMQARLRRRKGYPEIADEDRERLDAYFERENRGLSELTGVDFASWWNLAV